MRKPNKSVLGTRLTSGVITVITEIDTSYVLDGGALLHRVRWLAGNTCKEVTMQYMSYARHRYGTCSFVFDGYSSRPSLKDHKHKRRAGKALAEMQVSPEMNVHRNQQLFLANEKNKVQFINLLSHDLRSDRHTVIQSESDADTKIVSAAIALASDGKQTTAIADDTDILVLPLFHWNAHMADIHLRCERTKAQNIPLKLIDIREAANHSHSGNPCCDTTSAVFGHGICRILKLAQRSQEVRQWCAVFAQEDAVGEAGERIFIST